MLQREVGAFLALVVFSLSNLGVFAVNRVVVRYTPFSNRKPFNCAVCFGFWVGMAFCWVFMSISGMWQLPVYAFYAAGSNAILWYLVTGEN